MRSLALKKSSFGFAALAVTLVLAATPPFGVGSARLNVGAGGGGTAQLTNPNRRIIVDGDPSDWANIPPTLVDPQGDGPFDMLGGYYPGNDILSVSITNDAARVYLLIEYAETPSIGITFLFLDTDLDSGTGCVPFIGTEYLMIFDPAGQLFHLGDFRDCDAGDEFSAAAIQFATQGRYVEASLSRGKLRRLSPKSSGFRIWGEAVPDVPASIIEFVLPPAQYDFR